MPLVEKTMTEAELRESIARLKRLAAANPAMARDFGQRAAEAQKELNNLLLASGGYSVTKDAEVEARISAARAEGRKAGYESGVADTEAKLAAEIAGDAAPTYEEFNATREKSEPEVVRVEHQDGDRSGEAAEAGGGDSVRGEAAREP